MSIVESTLPTCEAVTIRYSRDSDLLRTTMVTRTIPMIGGRNQLEEYRPIYPYPCLDMLIPVD